MVTLITAKEAAESHDKRVEARDQKFIDHILEKANDAILGSRERKVNVWMGYSKEDVHKAGAVKQLKAAGYKASVDGNWLLIQW